MYLKETFGNFASIYYIGKISIPNKSNIRYTLMKNRLKAMESYLRLAALEFNNPVQDTAHYALALTLDYFETYDNLHNSDRHYIFCQLYFKSAYRNASEVKKSMHLSVSVATLCRYGDLLYKSQSFILLDIILQHIKCSNFLSKTARKSACRSKTYFNSSSAQASAASITLSIS